jgi:hypothetical protein
VAPELRGVIRDSILDRDHRISYWKSVIEDPKIERVAPQLRGVTKYFI